MSGPVRVAVDLLLSGVMCGCRQDMHDQPRYGPLQGSAFFATADLPRPYIEGTVARGQLNSDPVFYTGKRGTSSSTRFHSHSLAAVLERGHERFNIYCSPCHGQTGEGNGMIVQRGFSHPPAYTSERVRTQPIGHYFDVMTNGFGAMHSYASRVTPHDRWAIAAYISVLQVSRSATVNDVPDGKRANLEGSETMKDRLYR